MGICDALDYSVVFAKAESRIDLRPWHLEGITMGYERFKIVVCLIVMFSIGFTACNTNSIDSKDNTTQLAEIAELIDVDFPAEARIVFLEKNDRNNEVAYYYVIYTPTPVKFNRPLYGKIPPEASIRSLTMHVKRKTLGKLKDTQTYCYQGGMKNGQWGAYQTNFETGSYLRVTQILF
jgi:hypothetical protein